MAPQAKGYVMLEDPTSQPLKSSLTLKEKSFLHNKQVGDRLHPCCEVFGYLVLRGKVCLNPQFANPLSSSRMGAIGPGITSIEEMLEFPVKRMMSKGAQIYSSSTHKMRGLHGAGAVIFRGCLFVDLVNTAPRDNVSIQSNQNPVEGRNNIFHFDNVDNEGVLQRYNSHTTAVCALLLLCIPVHQNCLVICVP
jgi:hypothetical protein